MGRPKKEKPTHSSGMFVYKATIGHTFDGKPIRKAFYSSTSKETAKAKANQYIIDKEVADRTGEAFVSNASTTFEAWANKWLETYKKGVVKDHTYHFTYKSNIDKYLIPYFGKAKINDIQQIDIQQYFNKVRGTDGKFLAKSTLDKQKVILKSMFDAAIDNDLCIKNPVKNISINIYQVWQKNMFTRKSNVMQ